jgi:hypothetical protein
MTIRVLTEFAHEDLYESMAILFEDRFGWELYRPIGMEWYERHIWNFERERLGDQVARQFLAEWDTDVQHSSGSVRWSTQHPRRSYTMLTYQQALDLKPDIVIATIAANELGLASFAGDIGAHYGIQVGNQGAPNVWSIAEFGLLSVTTPGFTPWKPHVTYHQEFSLDTYHPGFPSRDEVATRVQCFTETAEYARFRRVAELVPEVRFRHYGHCGAHDEYYGGDAPTVAQIADEMRAAKVGWHDKRWSDGYGHVVHAWFATGRPVIGSASYYSGAYDDVPKLAEPLFVEGVTSFDIDKRSDAELASLVRRLVTDEDYWMEISVNAFQRFGQVVDFDSEAQEIRTMLDNVLSDKVPE